MIHNAKPCIAKLNKEKQAKHKQKAETQTRETSKNMVKHGGEHANNTR